MQGIESLEYEVRDQPLVPDGGMQQLKGAADLLAEFGRNGDTYVVHAAEGETVIPMEVLESSPKLKKMIYAQMEELGLQPERYVIGNELNSLNPVTGQPEFFFKKLFKKIKKVGKKVIRLAKKVAPIVLPLVLPFVLGPLGAPLFLSTGIGSLAGNLIAGNSFKDSLKSAAIAAVTAGTIDKLGGGSGFGTGSEAFQNIKDSVSSGIESLTGPSPSTLAESLTASSSAPLSTATASNPVSGFDVFGEGVSNVASGSQPITDSFFAEAFGSGGIPNINLNTVTSTGSNLIPTDQLVSIDPNFSGLGMEVLPSQVAPRGTVSGDILTDRFASSQNPMIDRLGLNIASPRSAGVTLNQTMPSGQLAGAPPELFNPNFQAPVSLDPTVTGVGAEMSSGAFSPNVAPSATARQAAVTGLGPDIPTGDSSYISDIIDKGGDLFSTYLSPNRPGLDPKAGVLTRYGPLLAVGGAGILAADALFPPEEQERLQLGDGRTGQDLLDEDIRSGTFQYGFNPRMFYGNNPYYQRGQFTRARQGGEIDGPGTGTSDSIPAMLSDGEFVMTAKAVRGAGGNDRKEGAKKMYAMMRKFENEAVA